MVKPREGLIAGVDKPKAPMLQKQLCNQGQAILHHVFKGDAGKRWRQVELVRNM